VRIGKPNQVLAGKNETHLLTCAAATSFIETEIAKWRKLKARQSNGGASILVMKASNTPPLLTQAQLPRILMVFAITLGMAGAWILTCELARSPRIGFPVDQNYQAAADQRWKVALAARMGAVRGDLWAELFFSFANSILIRSGPDFGAIETLNEALPAARRALVFAPLRSEVWLLLAEMAKDYELETPSAATAVAMSYYTAPYNEALTPLRLSLATRGNAVRDAGLRQLVEQDLQFIFASKPNLRPAVIAAYATASAEGKHLIESVIKEADPAFLMRLQKKVP